MKRLALVLAFTSGCSLFHGVVRQGGLYGNAVHRFFPDLDRRENAIRYGRWRALEVAWRDGISPELDRTFSQTLRLEMQKLPDFAPDARLCAPAFFREAPRTFGALVATDALEKEVADALAASDASPSLDDERIQAAIARYRREPDFLSEPASPPSPPASLATLASARLLLTGDWLFAQSAEDLAASGYGEQRWKIHSTIERYDRDIVVAEPSVQTAWYRQFAPTFAARYGSAAEILDRATLFRAEVFGALLAGDHTGRERALRAVESRYGLAR